MSAALSFHAIRVSPRLWTTRAGAPTPSPWRCSTPSWILASCDGAPSRTGPPSEWQCWTQTSRRGSREPGTTWTCRKTALRPAPWAGSARWTRIRASPTTSGTASQKFAPVSGRSIDVLSQGARSFGDFWLEQPKKSVSQLSAAAALRASVCGRIGGWDVHGDI